jgi:hypothetical protein
MPLVLELPSDLQNKLSEEAAQLGIPIDQYVLRLLSAGRTGSPLINTGGELLEYWKSEGLVGTRSDIAESSTHAREVRKNAELRVKG